MSLVDKRGEDGTVARKKKEETCVCVVWFLSSGLAELREKKINAARASAGPPASFPLFALCLLHRRLDN
jgi:hypothetical protein